MPSKLHPGELRLRVLLGPDIPMGPGKADLLEAIHRTGSISAAGQTGEQGGDSLVVAFQAWR